MTLFSLFEQTANDSPAITAPSQIAMTHGQLREQMISTVKALNNVGISRKDRVAISLPNGATAASSFLSVAAGASAAPLNPGYKESEFRFYLDDLKARCLIVEKNSDLPSVNAARELQIPIIELEPTNQVAGQFNLYTGSMEETSIISEDNLSIGTDEALVLHTSGTTGRPKIVPLSVNNLMISTDSLVQSLELRPEDRGLGIMPLFHIHGLMAVVAAPLAAGGSVFYTPGFNAKHIVNWMDEAQMTWYSGVPTMHQQILTQAKKDKNISIIKSLTPDMRFVRSASAALPPSVLLELESIFNVPVTEYYAMTEAAHPMTGNPISMELRRPGTVGIPMKNTEVRIIDPKTNEFLSDGETGDIVIRGDNVTTGYEGNAEANAKDFIKDGWFRTGDIGHFSQDGEKYLTLVARSKETINRGGETIAPVEIENVLLDHPAVAQAVVFSLPSDKWGEEVGAAIVLEESYEDPVTGQELQKFVRDRLADGKVPVVIEYIEELPKGPTGKLKRIGLSENLGLSLR